MVSRMAPSTASVDDQLWWVPLPRCSSIIIQDVKSEHASEICYHELWKRVRFDITDIAYFLRWHSKQELFRPDGLPPWIRTKHLSQGRNVKKTQSCHADCSAVVAMQARKWPICFQGRYVKSMSTSQYTHLTISVAEPVPYMAKALAESGDRRKRVGTPDFCRGDIANEI